MPLLKLTPPLTPCLFTGPLGYPNRTEADGANLLARAVAPHQGVVMWRAFVYGNGKTGQEDRARQAGDTFLWLDGQFDDNVIVQVKNGPMDFQVREPCSPLLTGALPNTNVMMEVQAAQEYTGQGIHAVGLAKQWEHYLNFDTLRYGPGSKLSSLLSRTGPFAGANTSISGMAAVSNLGNWKNWTGSIWGQSNTYAFGRMAWDPTLSSAAVNGQWARQTFGSATPAPTLAGIEHILDVGWEVFENYTRCAIPAYYSCSPFFLGLLSYPPPRWRV